MSKRSDFFVDTVVDVLECGTLWAGVVLRSPPCWINTEIVSSLLFSPAAPCLGSEEVDCWDLGVVVLFLCDSFESWGGKNRSTRNPSVTASRRTSSSAFRGICVTAMTNRWKNTQVTQSVYQPALTGQRGKLPSSTEVLHSDHTELTYICPQILV